MSTSEKELLLPSLYFISKYSNMNTTILIEKLTELFNPTGSDAEILQGRNDTHFSQKVRNLTGSHYHTNDMSLYTIKNSNGYFSITNEGKRFLEKNIDNLNYIFNSGFDYKDKVIISKKITTIQNE